MKFLKRTPKTAEYCQVNEITTIPCAACGLSFTSECGRDAIILLIKHLRENRTEPKHWVEFVWMKRTILLLEVHGRNSRCRTRLEVSKKTATRRY